MRWSQYVILALSICAFWIIAESCNQPSWNRVISPSEIIYSQTQDPVFERNSCVDYESYMYDPEHPEFTPEKRIRVNLHFVNSLDGKANYDGEQALEYGKRVIFYCNAKLEDNLKMNLPEGNDTPVFPVKFRYVLTPDANDPGNEGIYIHYLEDPFFISHGKNRNNYDRTIIKELAVYPDSILNIFYMVHSPDSLKSPTYKGPSGGIALGNHIKVGTKFNPKDEPWRHASLINHEIGHVLSLPHSWNKHDGCDDTPPHPNCWSQGAPPCDGVISNNVMDYNSNQNAYTPCQLARTYRAMSKAKDLRRELVIKDWCNYDSNRSIIINDTVVWSGSMDLFGDVYIEPGGVLYISCEVHFPKGSSLYIKKGGNLHLNNAVLYNDCGEEWEGIILESKGKNSGKIIQSGPIKILNTKFTNVLESD